MMGSIYIVLSPIADGQMQLICDRTAPPHRHACAPWAMGGAGDRERDENGNEAAGHRRRRRRRAGGGCNLDGERDVDEGALVDRALFQVLKIVVNAVNECALWTSALEDARVAA